MMMMTTTRIRSIVPACLLLTIACADPSVNAEIGDEAESSESLGESESETGPAPEALAHDIDISVVEINQGVATPIVVAGEWVGPGDRNAPIVSGRDTLLRAYWSLGPDFEPRAIMARLTLEPPGSEPVIREKIIDIGAESFAGDLGRSFTFDIAEADMLAGTNFSIALWEVDPSFASLPPPAPELAPISPRDGSMAAIGIQPEQLAIKVVLVPLVANWPGCATTVPIDELLTNFHDMLLMKNPTQTVELEVRAEPLSFEQAPGSFWDILPAIQEARIADGVAANVYYYGVIDACTNSDIDGAGGMAWSIVSDEKSADFERVAAGLYLDYDPQWNADTFVHELGHLQGLAHVYCPNQSAAGPDPAYPYEDGVIGVWGFGIRDFKLRSPTVAHDYMSYCYSGNWTSDWTWSKNFARVRTLTSWDAEASGAAEPEGTLLIGVLTDDGREQWWTIAGRIPDQDLARARVQVRAFPGAGGEVYQPNATRHRPPEGGATIVTVELPSAAMPDRIESLGHEVWRPRRK